jgi:hypothetical protein
MDRLAPGGEEYVVVGAALLRPYFQPFLGPALAVISEYLHGAGSMLTMRDRPLLVVPSIRWPAMMAAGDADLAVIQVDVVPVEG